VPKQKRSSKRAAGEQRAPFLERLGWSRRDAVGFIVAALAIVAIVVNGLLLQAGPHPAPMFKDIVATVPARKDGGQDVILPRMRPREASARSEAGRPTPEIVADIQRELARRGYYDGVVDGRYGPRTDAAIRDFEQAAGMKPGTEPTEALLTAIRQSKTRPARTPSGLRPSVQQVRLDPIAEVLSPSKRIVAVQRALAEFGYGQLKPTGEIDADTKSAIERFERDRRLPITGQISSRLTRELSAVTGRPLD
jgi:peptidoglycan hydrolase-like protein with peptidoglycan-binding domain